MISMHVTPFTLVEGRQLLTGFCNFYLWTNHWENIFSIDYDRLVGNNNIF